MKFSKYHALGNDYIVLDSKQLEQPLSAQTIQTICNRNYGVGSDGILLGSAKSATCDFTLRIFNPDGSEAETSGNGLRIFSRYLWDHSLVTNKPFTIETKGGAVSATVGENGRFVTVQMGQVRFTHHPSGTTPITPQTLTVDGRTFNTYLASVGNPHCVIPVDVVSRELAEDYGRIIETHPRFPNKTNVQFVQRINRTTVQIEIWERGAGYTLASGSSSTAAAAVMHALRLCDASIAVQMPGGTIHIDIDEQFFATMTGSVCKICDGTLADEVFYYPNRHTIR